MKNKIKILMTSFALSGLMLTGCSDFLETNPTGQLPDNIVLSSDQGLQMLLNGIYRTHVFEGGMDAGATSQALWNTLTGGDMVVAQPHDYYAVYRFTQARYDASSAYTANLWQFNYKLIAAINNIINNADKASGDVDKIAAIKGQAQALRGRIYFDLVRHYQHTYAIAKNELGVPLMLVSELEVKPRSTVQEVYDQILKDLHEAESALSAFNRETKTVYNLDVVNFLLANVYLTMQNWEKAIDYADKVISKYPLMSIEQYKDGFGTMNDEWVLGYICTPTYGASYQPCWYDFGDSFGLPDMMGSPWAAQLLYPSPDFVELMEGDPRMLYGPNPAYKGKAECYKFRQNTNIDPFMDLIDMRCAEMYLVKSEALAKMNKTSESLKILNALQMERGANLTTTVEQEALLDEIALERRKELYGEGHDFYDAMRYMKPISKIDYYGNETPIELEANSNKLILMIPHDEIIRNVECVQNPDPSTSPVFIPQNK